MAKKIKGVILAGGSGTRLYPNTKVTNKHLLPVYNQPMIYYPIQTLLKAGITDILILPGKDNAGDFARLLGSGKEFNANFSFKVQDHAGGLAYAVGLAEDFVGDDNFVVIFGDNILEDNIIKDVQDFEDGAEIFLKQVSDPERFGVAELDGNKVVHIEEKPAKPKSNWAAVGVYIYDSKAFEYIKDIKPSSRGELEITDLNNVYIKQKKMKAGFIKGFWFDAGTHESLVEAAYKLKELQRPIEILKFEQKKSPEVVVGGILYDSPDGKYSTSKYLPYFLPSLKKQDYRNIKVLFVDNSPNEDNLNRRYIKDYFPEAEIIRPGFNSGFGKANNLMIKRAIELKADYFLASNVDMLYESNVIAELVNAIIKSPQNASATCKIKQWNFSEKDRDTGGRTNFIDTVGIDITREHRFIDIGQGEIDYGQYDGEKEIFGPSGAAAMYSLAALEDVAFVNEGGRKEYFDELMFMYKEDVDLAYRLQTAGYKSVYTSSAVINHDRSVIARGKGIIGIIKGRIARPKKYKEWSWLNHHIILQKMVDSHYPNDVKLKTIWYEIKSNLYVLFFEPFIVMQWWQLFKIRKQIKARRDQVKKRIKIKSHLDKLMG
ncbi:NTP transferase domain-containing protein [Candidatus Falkowbacteria bacterium]|nr:NTP transferase domain-containing protein [Candidatus Falkowbacteria bacterium]